MKFIEQGDYECIMRPKEILIIEDEESIRDILSYSLRKEGFEIKEAASGREGLNLLRESRPDLILLDLMLPDMSGFDVCRQLSVNSKIPVIMITAKSDMLDKVLGMELGADDYITKPFSPKEVAYKMKAFFRRNQYQEKAHIMYQFGDITIDEAQGTVLKGDTLLSLTAKEFNILLFLIKNPNQIFSKARLYEAVWGETYLGNDNIMMVHMRHLREKIEDNPSKPHYLVTVRGLGYKLNTKGDVR